VVLEVGSGQAPNPRSNVLCDLYVGDDTERNQEPLQLDRPLVVGDLHHLPFKDGSFDYVICSHVLEHVEDPARCISELTRVAGRGYVEVPTALNERMLPFPFHRWQIEADADGLLVFQGKETPVPDAELAEWFRRVVVRNPGWNDFFFDHLEDLGNVHAIRWSGDLEVRVVGEPGHAQGSTDDVSVDAIRRTLARIGAGSLKDRLLRTLWKPLRRSSEGKVFLDSRLACPGCRGELEASGQQELVCRSCQARYPRIQVGRYTVPILIR
jgi:SAM-dependent methyltransferase